MAIQTIGLNQIATLASGDPYVLPTTFAAVHQAQAGVATYDLVYLFVTNTDTVARAIVCAVGGQADPGSRLIYSLSIPANGAVTPVLQGHFCNNGRIVYAASPFSGTRLLLTGYVLRGP